MPHWRQLLAECPHTLVHTEGRFVGLPDGQRMLVATDRFGEFRELAVLDLKTQELKRITSHIPWDIGGGSISADTLARVPTLKLVAVAATGGSFLNSPLSADTIVAFALPEGDRP